MVFEALPENKTVNCSVNVEKFVSNVLEVGGLPLLFQLPPGRTAVYISEKYEWRKKINNST